MIKHLQILQHELIRRIRCGDIMAAGNVSSHIYGRLDCVYGKRMNKRHRIFFKSFQQATNHGFRPCAHCLKDKYSRYKKNMNKPGVGCSTRAKYL